MTGIVNESVVGGLGGSGGPSSPPDSGGSGGQNAGAGKPQTPDSVEKHFERRGFEIEEITPEELPEVSNQARDVAFRVTDGTLDGEVKASHRIGVFAAPGATIQLGGHFSGGGNIARFEDDAGGSEVRRVDVDASALGMGVKWTINRGVRLRDITVRGEQQGAPETKWPAGIYIGNLNHDENAVLENVNQPGGAARTQGVPSHHDAIGVILGGSCDGDLVMRNCEHGGFPNNSVYASGPTKQGNDGRAIIENCTMRNSDRDQVRVGADSVVRGCTLVAGEKKPGFDNLRGVWARFARGVTIEDCTIKTYPGSDAGSAVRIDPTAGEVDINNVDIELRGTNYRARGIRADPPTDETRDTGDVSIQVRDSRIHGDAPTRDGVLIEQRPGSGLTNVDIDLPNCQQEVDIR